MGSCSSKNTGAEVHLTANGQKPQQPAPPTNAASPKSAPVQSVQEKAVTVEKEEVIGTGDYSVSFIYFCWGEVPFLYCACVVSSITCHFHNPYTSFYSLLEALCIILAGSRDVFSCNFFFI